MKKLLTLLALAFCLDTNAQTWDWAKSGNGIGNTTIGTGDEGMAVCTDTIGNVFATGFFSSPTLTFGTYTISNAAFSVNGFNVFIAKYNASGNVLWAKSAGGTVGDVFGNSISTDGTGNVFVTGYFSSPTITFSTYTLTNAGNNYNIFIAKYDANGNVLWAKSAGGANNDESNSVSTDATGNVFVTGTFYSPTITFGTYTLTNSAISAGGNNVFIAKYDASGNVLWAKRVGGTVSDVGNSVSTDAFGNIFVTGGFSSPTIAFGTYTLTNASGNNNIFIAKYDANGNVLWAKNPTGTGGNIGYAVSTDMIGNVFLTGSFACPILTFGTYTLTNASGSNNAFITKYDANGNVLWAKNPTGTGSNVGYALSTDMIGNVFVTGGFSFGPNIVFGTDTLTELASYPSPDPMFIVKYDANGNVLCASSLPSGGDDQNGVSVDRFGNAYICADYMDNFTVGTDTLTFNGLEKVFVAKWFCNRESGIEQITNSNEIKVYPNPNNGCFTIEISSSERQTISIFDVNGKLVLSQTINGKASIDANIFQDGVYNISLISSDGVINKRLVIVK
ncbi:MAG TPA: T9SS type A sorting domain-containing protein [Bacteroidia bacterium]|nr:T9SS type A sorting domain-containing protein [Bacteroidia bacterium]